MGINNLLPFLKSITKRKHVSEYKGLKAGIDTYVWLHKGILNCGIELYQNTPTTKHIDYCLKRIEYLLSYEIKLVMVFDGRKLPQKKNTEQSREQSRSANKTKGIQYLKLNDLEKANKYLASSFEVTPQFAYQLYQDVECIVAPYEADAQLVYLNQVGYVDFLISIDSDLVAFGGKRTFYKLEETGDGDEINQDDIFKVEQQNISNWNKNMFLTLCIMSGCDYLDSIPKVGQKSAFKLISQHSNIIAILNVLRKEGKVIVPIDYEQSFVKSFCTFRFQYVYCPIQRKMVNLNKLDLDILKQRYVSQISSEILYNADEEWLNYESNILEKFIIYKILQSDFDWSFLGDLKNEQVVQIAQFQIDPDTLQPYKEVQFQMQSFPNSMPVFSKLESDSSQQKVQIVYSLPTQIPQQYFHYPKKSNNDKCLTKNQSQITNFFQANQKPVLYDNQTQQIEKQSQITVQQQKLSEQLKTELEKEGGSKLIHFKTSKGLHKPFVKVLPKTGECNDSTSQDKTKQLANDNNCKILNQRVEEDLENLEKNLPQKADKLENNINLQENILDKKSVGVESQKNLLKIENKDNNKNLASENKIHQDNSNSVNKFEQLDFDEFKLQDRRPNISKDLNSKEMAQRKKNKSDFADLNLQTKSKIIQFDYCRNEIDDMKQKPKNEQTQPIKYIKFQPVQGISRIPVMPTVAKQNELEEEKIIQKQSPPVKLFADLQINEYALKENCNTSNIEVKYKENLNSYFEDEQQKQKSFLEKKQNSIFNAPLLDDMYFQLLQPIFTNSNCPF